MGFENSFLSQIKFVNLVVARILGMLINAFLSVLIFKFTPKILQPYVRILIITVVIDFGVSFFSLAFQVTPLQTGGSYYAIFEVISLGYYLPLEISAIGMAFISFFAYSAVSILPLHYIYRLLVICYDFYLNITMLFVLLLISISFPGYMLISRILQFWPKTNQDYYFENLSNNTDAFLENEKMPMFLVCPLDKYAQVAFSPAIFYSIIYAIIIICSIKIVRKVNESNQSLTPKSLRLQKQMNRILFMQAAIPFVVSVIPLTLNNVGLWLETKIFSNMDLPAWLLTSWVPVFNAISTIIFIANYRNAVFSVCALKQSSCTIADLSSS